MRRQPEHLLLVDEVGFDSVLIGVLDMLFVGVHPIGCEGEEQATHLTEPGVVARFSLEAREQIYSVANRPPHEGSGSDLVDQTGCLSPSGAGGLSRVSLGWPRCSH